MGTIWVEEENESLKQETKMREWWVESKMQLLISVPMMFINLSYYLIPLISVMYAGHLGDLEFAASNLAFSWTTASGLVFVMGLSGALETLCGQSFGAKNYKMLGVFLHSSLIISIFFSILISIIWWNTKPILILFHQNPEVATASTLYLKYSIPGIFAYGMIQNIIRFSQAQSKVFVPMICALVSVGLHTGIAYLLVHRTPLGFRGASLAASISLWISLILLVLYVMCSKDFKLTHIGFSSASFSHLSTCLKLALPSAAMVCLEYWCFETLVLLGGLMPNSEVTTSLAALCVNTEAIAYMVTNGLSASVSTRVSNELGAGNPKKSRLAMWVALTLSFSLALLVALSLAIGHNVWAGLFTNNSQIIHKFGSITPLFLLSIPFDSIQGVFSGVSRGCGWQHLATYTNLAAYYLIAIPISVLVAFKVKLYAKGLWIGLTCGLFSQACFLCLIATLRKWKRIEIPTDESERSPDETSLSPQNT